jgi:hypothetical protein
MITICMDNLLRFMLEIDLYCIFYFCNLPLDVVPIKRQKELIAAKSAAFLETLTVGLLLRNHIDKI